MDVNLYRNLIFEKALFSNFVTFGEKKLTSPWISVDRGFNIFEKRATNLI